MRIGRAAVPSGSAARTNTPHAKTEYRDAVSTYLPVNHNHCNQRGGHIAWLGIGEQTKHNVRINKPLLGMAEHTRESTYNFESKLMPKADRRLIGGNH
jgi:hypothetical protein